MGINYFEFCFVFFVLCGLTYLVCFLLDCLCFGGFCLLGGFLRCSGFWFDGLFIYITFVFCCGCFD